MPVGIPPTRIYGRSVISAGVLLLRTFWREEENASNFYRACRREFLVGQHLESFKNRNVWVPTKEHDVDLLVTDKANKKAVSLQVKFSKDFLPTLNAESTVIAGLQACTWFAFDRARLAKSTADLWVLVLPRSAERKNDFLVMPPKELLAKLDALHPGTKKFQVYVWVTKAQRAWLARGITRAIETQISNGTYQHTGRDVTAALNDWSHI